jgi:serine/threonine protein kinase/tetratricopeptide (TPR) repeat protein
MSEPDELTGATKREGPSSARTAKSHEPEYLARGTLVGRYVVLDRLGEGGMGVVYRAFDPELDRKVAVKLLQARSDGSCGGGAAWLLREAQALARLSHPNVVAVHDVGTLSGDQVFVAMELVDGTTLRQWLREDHSWREVCAIMSAAGAGLAAAHRAGLVHRDFKPENVLVGGDGRVRVMDFGLARLQAVDDDAASEGELGARSPLSESLTVAGSVVGTPVYMAPEIFRGKPADARSDQFSFGVTLFEGLYRKRPYDQRTLARGELPAPVPPKDASVPARLERLAARAIASDPAQRFASMDELLSVLAIDPTARRRRVLLAVAGLLAVVLAVFGAYTFARSSVVCRGAEKRLAGVWDPATRDAIHRAYTATKVGYADKSFAALVPALDRYANEWTAASTESCEATRVRRDQTEEVLELRQACLDGALQELAALTHVLAEPNKKAVDLGDKIVGDLEPISRCANITALRDPSHTPAEIAPQVNALVKRVAETKALVITGRYLEALTRSTDIRKDAEVLGWKPVEVDLDMVRGIALGVTGSYDDATVAFSNAVWGAETVRRDDIVAHSALSLAEIAAQGHSRPGEAQIWLGLAKAAAKRYGTDRQLDRRIYQIEGIVDALSGNASGAVAAHEKALVLARAMYSNDDPSLWEDEEILATTLTKQSRYVEAVPHFEHALELRTRVVGNEHADAALLLSNLASCYGYSHDPRAKAMFERAIELRQKLFGKTSPMLAPTLNNYANMLVREGEAQTALPLAERALAMATAFPGKEHYAYHEIATDHADALITAGRLADARVALDELVALETKLQSTTLSRTLAIRAELALAERAWPAAAADAEHSLQIYEAASKDNPETWRPRAALGRAQLELGNKDDARKNLEQAIATAESLHFDLVQVKAAREALAGH